MTHFCYFTLRVCKKLLHKPIIVVPHYNDNAVLCAGMDHALVCTWTGIRNENNTIMLAVLCSLALLCLKQCCIVCRYGSCTRMYMDRNKK